MPLTNHADEALVLYLFGDTSFTPPANFWVALFTTAPNQGGTGGTEVSTSGTAYARVEVANNTTNWVAVGSEPTDGYSVQNGTVITFPQATSSWGTVLAAGLYDASTSGTLWGYGTFSGVAIGSGITPSFAVGAITITNN